MKKVIVTVIFLLVFSFVVYGQVSKDIYLMPADSGNNIKEKFIIKKGEGSTEVGENLAKYGFVKNKYYFWYYVWRTKTDSKLQAGVYEISKNMTIPELTDKFVKGDVKKDVSKLVVPEGFTLDKIIHLIEKQKPEIEKDFSKLVKCKCLNEQGCQCDKFSEKYDFIKNIPRGLDLEGYLFPDTYFIAKNETATTLVEKFLKNFQQKMTAKEVSEKIEGSQYNLHQILTIASIVEREVKDDADRRMVAGIFLNRLAVGHPLQSDATLSYILKQDKMKYNQKDLEVQSEYNTYQRNGLPPGPICNPGQKAILAVLNPQETDFFYFLNDVKTGETVYAKTFEEHKKNKSKHGL